MDIMDKFDNKKRLMLAALGLGALGGMGVMAALLGSLSPSKRTKAAGAAVDIALDSLLPGHLYITAWRQKPVWILQRTPDMMARLQGHDSQLIDPLSREETSSPPYCRNRWRARSERPEIWVAFGLCTHLGCSPVARLNAGTITGLPLNWPGGFVCPCHGAQFDLAGRVFIGTPAPRNLDIPPYRYLSDNRLRIGEDETNC